MRRITDSAWVFGPFGLIFQYSVFMKQILWYGRIPNLTTQNCLNKQNGKSNSLVERKTSVS